ncbi:MAG TPA: hypothetical protein PKD91_06585 [Bacteroidia bacterium]|nr:hypothetical protein [Bacteroidia bacterium]
MKKLLSLVVGFLIAFAATATTPPDPVKSFGTNQEISCTINSHEFNAILVYEYSGIDQAINFQVDVIFGSLDSAYGQTSLNAAEHYLVEPCISPAEKLECNWQLIQKVWFYSGIIQIYSLKKYNPPNSRLV